MWFAGLAMSKILQVCMGGEGGGIASILRGNMATFCLWSFARDSLTHAHFVPIDPLYCSLMSADPKPTLHYALVCLRNALYLLDNAKDSWSFYSPSASSPSVQGRDGHTTRAVLNAACKVSSIIHRFLLYRRLVDVGRSKISFDSFRKQHVRERGNFMAKNNVLFLNFFQHLHGNMRPKLSTAEHDADFVF
jgi:hypothetical protein